MMTFFRSPFRTFGFFLIAAVLYLSTGQAEAASVGTAKSTYTPSEKIIVTFADFPGHKTDWITIVPTSTPDNTYNEWYYTDGAHSGTMNFNALSPGTYEVRAYYDWASTGTYEVRLRSTFTVVSTSTPAKTGYVWTTKNVYNANEPITVEFTGFPGYETDWITLVPASYPDNHYDQWAYTKGQKSGSMNFNGLAAGRYEVRCYFNWNGTGSYAVQGRYAFTVQ